MKELDELIREGNLEYLSQQTVLSNNQFVLKFNPTEEEIEALKRVKGIEGLQQFVGFIKNRKLVEIIFEKIGETPIEKINDIYLQYSFKEKGINFFKEIPEHFPELDEILITEYIPGIDCREEIEEKNPVPIILDYILFMYKAFLKGVEHETICQNFIYVPKQKKLYSIDLHLLKEKKTLSGILYPVVFLFYKHKSDNIDVFFEKIYISILEELIKREEIVLLNYFINEKEISFFYENGFKYSKQFQNELSRLLIKTGRKHLNFKKPKKSKKIEEILDYNNNPNNHTYKKKFL